jgi:3-oxoacyl-[acyl-carrier-protein] synthase-3
VGGAAEMSATEHFHSGDGTVTQPRTSGARFGAVVVGTGHYVPLRVRSNDDVARLAGTDNAWITARTGIRERRVAEDTENSGTMAYEASWRALADAGVAARDLDLIIVCTVTPEMAVPSTACLLQERLGVAAQEVPAFDLAAACSGFVYGLATAHAHMQLGETRHVLVVGVDTLSRMTDCSDRATAALLADGAGAVVLRRSDDPSRGILFTHVGADGSGHELLYAPGGLNRPRSPADETPGSAYYLRMDGPRVFKLAVNRMAHLVEEAAAVLGCSVSDFDLLIPHQANRRILDAVGDRLGLAPERVYSNIDRYGNTSAASIPIAYDEARKQGRVRPGGLVVMVAFGAGLTWGSAVIRENSGVRG